MTAYVEKASGVQVDIPDELAERIGGFEPLDAPSAPEAKPAARRPRKPADED